MDEFLSIEDLRWEFGASRAWMYKYLAPHIKSITVKCSTDDGERLCKRYSLDDARRVVAEKARAEVYSVPVKADPREKQLCSIPPPAARANQDERVHRRIYRRLRSSLADRRDCRGMLR